MRRDVAERRGVIGGGDPELVAPNVVTASPLPSGENRFGM